MPIACGSPRTVPKIVATGAAASGAEGRARERSKQANAFEIKQWRQTLGYSTFGTAHVWDETPRAGEVWGKGSSMQEARVESAVTLPCVRSEARRKLCGGGVAN